MKATLIAAALSAIISAFAGAGAVDTVKVLSAHHNAQLAELAELSE